MPTTTRIYHITDGGKSRLVRASHPANALRHVAEQAYTVRVATQDDLETLLPAGVKVEEIGEPSGRLGLGVGSGG